MNQMGMNEHLVGMDRQAAIEILESSAIAYRVTQVDDTYMLCTQDYRPDRVNLKIVNGVVDDAYHG